MGNMTYDFFMGQLRLIVIAFLAYGSGRGWLTPTDSGLATAIITPIGLIAGPWIWSIYRNLGQKLVPKDSVAIDAGNVHTIANPVGGTAIIGDNDLNKTVTAKIVGAILLAFMLASFAWPSSALAQITKPRILGAIADKIEGPRVTQAGSDLLAALDEKLLPDLQYALKIALAGNSKVTAPCYQAWIDIIEARQKSVTGPDGQPLPIPNPHVITSFEKAVALRNALQPDSEFMIRCSPVASMVKKDILGFIATVISGGAGLAALGL
jgi:hypothetical protein